MKKFLLSLCCLAGALAASAQTSVTFTQSDFSEETGGYGAVKDGVTVFVAGSDAGMKYDPMRFYKNSTIKVSIAQECYFTTMEFTADTNAYATAFANGTVTSGSSVASEKNVTWTAANNATYEVTFTMSNAQARVASFTVNYVEVAAAVAAPTFSVAAGTVGAGTEVELSCTTEGAEIHYTLDGSDPTAESALYSTPLVIDATTTVKAIAVKGEDVSNIASATYTVLTASTLSQVIGMSNGTAFLMGEDLTITYASGAYTYVANADGDVFGLIYKYDLGFNAGDVIASGWQGTVKDYYDLIELVPVGDLTVNGTAAVPAPAVVTTTAELDALPRNRIVTIKNVTFSEDTPATGSFFGEFAGVYAIFRNNFGVAATPAGEYDVEAAIGIFNSTKQYYPISYTALTTVVYAPEFSVESGAVDEGTTVALSCATEDAEIHYTLDGTDPTAESTLYSAPIAINEAMTIKAIAYYDGVCSSIASASYTIRDAEAGTIVVFANNELSYGKDTTCTWTAEDGLTFETSATVSVNSNYPVKNGNNLRMYRTSNNIMTVNAPANYKISAVALTSVDTTAPVVTFTVGTTDKDVTCVDKVASFVFSEPVSSFSFNVNSTDNTAKNYNFSQASFTLEISASGIEVQSVEDAEAPVEYFNLQGVRVANPQGIVIERRGNTVRKVVR